MSELETLEFAPVLLTEVFDSMAASNAWYDKSKLEVDGDAVFPFVSRTRAGNGIEGFCPRQTKPPETGRAITIGLDTQTVAYQPVAFYTSQNIQVLRHSLLNEANGAVITSLIQEQMRKFSWGGNGATLGRLRKTHIMVPVTKDSRGEQVVDWDGITRLGKELFVAAVERAAHARQHAPSEVAPVPELKFEPMYVLEIPGQQTGLFRAHKGKRLITAHRKRGTTPFVAGSRNNNSIVDYADMKPMFSGGRLTLIYNGDGGTGHAKYQPVPFSASDDVIVLEPLCGSASEDALLLLVTLLTHQCVPKFGFGYKLTLHRLSRQKIMVPVTVDSCGERIVDWTGLDTYGSAIRARAERGMQVVLEPVPASAGA